MSRIMLVLRDVAGVLTELEQHWAVVGGIAVSMRTEPRFTRDVDLAIAVADDAAAEALIHLLGQRGYTIVSVMEHDTAGRLATVRLQPNNEKPNGVIVDLLFASSGIENEIVRAAGPMRVLPDLTVPVACREHLIALKLLALGPWRRNDAGDLGYLLKDITPSELARTREAIALIEARGFNRGKALNAVLDEFIVSLQ
jgi:hypothetical protein